MAKKPTSWQKVGIQAKFRRFLMFVAVILLILFVLNTFFHIFTIGQFFKKPLSNDVNKDLQGSSWDGKTKLVIIFDTTPLTVGVFDPKNKRVDAIVIDRETRSDMPYNYGWNRLGAVRELGNLDSSAKGKMLLVDTMAKFLQTPVDGFVIVHDDQWNNLDSEKISKGVRDFASVKTFPKIISSKDWQSRFETNLTKFDILRLWWGLRTVRSDKVVITDFSKEGLLTDILLPDGSHGFGPEEVSVATFSKKVFFDDQISEERLNIEVLNGTDTPGIASNVARLVENVGGSVVRVANSEVESIDKCAVRVGRHNISNYTTLRLAKALRCDIEEVQIEGDESQADLTILVGRDLIGRF